MKNYQIKLTGTDEAPDGHFLSRLVSLASSGKVARSPLKISKFNLGDFDPSIQDPIHEVYMRTSFDQIRDIDRDNVKKDAFVTKKLNPKLRVGRLNAAFLEVDVRGQAPSAQLFQTVANFACDLVYSNKAVDLLVPPILVMDKGSGQDVRGLNYMSFLRILQETASSLFGSFRFAYLFPSYLSRNDLPTLLDFYENTFGPGGLMVLDMDGKTFSGSGYTSAFQLMRELTKRKVEQYGLYLLNHKAKKKSGRVVPSEDFIGFLSGASFIGPSHKFSPLPTKVTKEMGSRRIIGKEFDGSDLMYHPVTPSTLSQNVKSWVRNQFDRSALTHSDLDLYNDLQTAAKASHVPDGADRLLKSLKGPAFLDELQKTNSKRKQVIAGISLNDFT